MLYAMSVHLTYGSIVLKHQNRSSWLSVQRLVVLGRPFVKQFALCYRSTVCLSVMLVYCGQTVGRIKMKLGTHVGLGPGNIALGGNPAPPPPKGHSPPIFGPYLLQPNGCMDQDATRHGARPWPRRLWVRWGPRSPLQKGGRAPSQFSVNVYCGQTAGWIKMLLGIEIGLSSGDFVLDGDPALPQKGAEPPSPIFVPFPLWPNGWMHQVATWYGGRPRSRSFQSCEKCTFLGLSPPPVLHGAQN